MPKILLVEDEPHLLMALEDTLLEEGFRVVTATHGRQALEILSVETVDLVVSDVMMPEMDGFELCRTVRSHAALGSLPFVFLTALGQRTDQRQGWEAGGDAYIVKPFDPDELISLIRARLKRIQQVQESLAPLITHLRELEQMKDEHLAIASHEFKGSLTAIRGYAESLLLHDHDPQTTRSHLAEIRQESADLANLVNQLLELSAFELGKIRLELEPVDLAALCRDVVEQMAMRHPRPRFHCNCDATVPLVTGDPRWLKRALVNLIENATKYAPNSPEVRVECLRVSKGVEIAVRDQGKGLDPDDLAKLGDWFFRVRRPDTQGIPGSGLGLALVRRVVQAHQGEWLAESAVGQGTRIGFVLPL